MEKGVSMYQIKNVILVTFIGLLSTSAKATEISKKTQKNYASIVVELTAKLAQLDIAMDNCAKKNKVSEREIHQCNLKRTSIDGLLYINLLAENNCTNEIQLEALTLLVKERNYRNHHKITPNNWNSIKQETLNFFDAYLARLPITSDQSVELEQMFLSIPKQQQTNLLNCKVLNKPFDALSVADSFTKQ